MSEGKIAMEIIHDRRNRKYPTKWKYFTFELVIFSKLSQVYDFFKLTNVYNFEMGSLA